ncbi:lysoplasmalogenase family protein [Flavobacterium sp. N1994]|uniref:lysoplasmalogenase family protein n=1 Tax=Flavobacterium sp. N1994 TaxID=2986827 RepID=UPI002222D73D|nr:lysoplasmalogenase family protein [Flavobacterium sp. N1994]
MIAIFEVLAEYLVNKPIICSLKPLLPLFLIVIYCLDSDRKNILFIIALLLSSLTNILFIPDTPMFLFYGIIVFTLHRIITIYLIFSLQKVIDYIPVIIATSPFLLIFFYLFSETPEIPQNSFYIIIVQNILISVLTGIALSSYVMNDNKQNSILLISALLFVMLQFVIFVEKYFLTNEFEDFFRPTAMTLNALAFYSFYKYVVTAEKSNHNNGLS